MGLTSAAAVTITARPRGGTLDPTTIPKYVDPLPIPEAMPKQDSVDSRIDVYEVAVRQFPQQVLPTATVDREARVDKEEREALAGTR